MTAKVKTAWDVLNESEYLTEKVSYSEDNGCLVIANEKDNMHDIFTANRQRMKALNIPDRLAENADITN